MLTEIPILVPTPNGNLELTIKKGESLIIVGANGSGKTRLGVFIDRHLSNSNIEVHRVGAHRSLKLNPAVVPPSYETATNRLRFGYDKGDVQYKHGHRWNSEPEVTLLNDFDHLVSALYAENNDVSISYRNEQRVAPTASPPPSAKIDQLKTLWQSLLPHRELIIQSGNLKTSTIGTSPQEYNSSDMSDGERVIFYLVAQALLAQPNAVLIFDEPELHLNKAIVGPLWDAIESSRQDCAFIYITHDVDFASSRRAASKYVVRSFLAQPQPCWEIELVPEADNLPADIVTKILGSRKAILFTEGDSGSLDASLYRRVYNEFTVLPLGSCDQVIHTVASFQSRSDLHRFGCAGIVDADGRDEPEIDWLKERGIYCLPVSEVENLLLLPNVFLSVAAELKFSDSDAQTKLQQLREVVLSRAKSQSDDIALRQTKRKIDLIVKKIGLSGSDISQLQSQFNAAISGVDLNSLFEASKAALLAAIAHDDFEEVLRIYDNKGLLSEMAKLLGSNQKSLEEFVGRSLKADQSNKIHQALTSCLPVLEALPRV
jgi:energy-coupling factor transporter ATP-binding protein EcfA2